MLETPQKPPLTFEISMTVLNALGRQLYRNFVTILGEAISNSWDADAENVWISLDTKTKSMIVRDDGHGMTQEDLQDKFLRIGYSKRKDSGHLSSKHRRPFIGAKGIGKLALLSCAELVTVVTKKDNQQSGCVIDNCAIDRAIKDDAEVREHELGRPNPDDYVHLQSIPHGTALIFQRVKTGNTTEKQLRKLLALFFRFSLADSNFQIYFNGVPVSSDDLSELAEKTQMIWVSKDFEDPFITKLQDSNATDYRGTLTLPDGARGFLATVRKPRDLTIYGASQKAGIDIFVNGRLRDRDIIRHLELAQVTTQYVYGQIHFDKLDDGTQEDVFTSSREGIRDDVEDYNNLLQALTKQLKRIFSTWDEERIKLRQPGDVENKSTSKEDRLAIALTNSIAERVLPKSDSLPERRSILKSLLTQTDNASRQYIAIYIIENYCRELIRRHNMNLSNKQRRAAQGWRQTDENKRADYRISNVLRAHTDDCSYLPTEELVKVIRTNMDGSTHNALVIRDEQINLFTYLRNVVAHTSGLTEEGSNSLTSLTEIIQSMIENYETTFPSEG